MRVLALTATAALLLLTGCDNQPEPSSPPTTQEALTTATATPDDVVASSEPAPTTAEPTTEEATTEEAPATAGGPPEMPGVASEQTKAGAAAYVGYYLDRVSWAHRIGNSEGLADLAQPTCQSCLGLAEMADEQAQGDDYLDYDLGEPLLTDTTARVEVAVTQLVGAGAGQGDIVVRLDWTNDGWLVQEITVVE